jgi:hypothetical protein
MGELADRIAEAAYKLGKDTGAEFGALVSNPYPQEDPRYNEWAKGWQSVCHRLEAEDECLIKK